MRMLLMLLFLVSLPTAYAQDGPPLWDGLPAVEADHLLGPYAGRRICPMCRHGYDAGILVFLRSDAAISEVRRMVTELRAVNQAIDHQRFRVFVLITGAAPATALLEVLRDQGNGWNVGHLPAAAADQAGRDFALALAQRSHALVFAQRRLLGLFDPLSLPASGGEGLRAHAEIAMRLLQSSYPEAADAAGPDAPKGLLWSAPARLGSRLNIAAGAQMRLCFAEARRPQGLAGSLVSLQLQDERVRRHWTRSDAEGCVQVRGLAAGQQIRVELQQVLEPAAHAIHTLTTADRQQVLLETAALSGFVSGRERVVGLPCEACAAVFDGLPRQLSAQARIAPAHEPGEALRLTGFVRDASGAPRAGIVLYAYQTDHKGRYPADRNLKGAAARHGRLRGWVVSAADGSYTFDSIRPASYPLGREPQHIHMHVIEPGRCTYYLGDVLFDDDPYLDDSHRRRPHQLRGGSGVVQVRGSADAGWSARRDIRLGANVPGYAACNE